MKKIVKFFKLLGPGFITGASDDDPAGIATYAQTGALFGYLQLWTAFFSLPLMTAVQEMCGRIGLVTGKGLAQVIKQHYHPSILYTTVSLLVIANVVNIGADLGAMAASMQLVAGMSFGFWILIMVVVTLILEIFVSYKTYSKYLKYLAYTLLSYVIAAFAVKTDWAGVAFFSTHPQIILSKDYIMNIVAIFGTTISPYLFFWQTAEEAEEEVSSGKLRTMGVGIPRVSTLDIKKMRLDTVVGMIFSQLVMLFIIITAAGTLYKSGIHEITSAAQVASALRPIAGDFAFLLFTTGIIGTGLLAVPILSGSASYAVAEAFNWKEGLYRKLRQAHGFYGVIIIATLVGLLINFIGINPIQALYYSAVVNGLIAPPLLILIVLISNKKSIMKEYANGKLTNILGIATIIVMGVSAVALIVTLTGLL